MPQPLSSKESSLFRTVVRNYEDKQYKKGLKAAEQILKKNPKHGDTMAMKALILNSIGKSDEAFALAKLALQADMKSHVCWHVYGLLYRSNKNFEEAIKAYKFALKLDPESQQIQRDLALLQIQMRDYQGYIISRRAMLQARSHVRQNWTALAIAHHLAGSLSEAEGVLTTYEETLKSPPSKLDFENSEAVMYKNSLIAEQGDYKKALEHLESAGKHNLDRLAVLELRAEYLSKLGRNEEAATAFRALIDRNSECKKYYDGLAAALNIESSNHKELKAIYDEYAEKYPRSDSARRLPLDFLDGDEFRTAADSYVHRMLDKGVPSTFANLKHLYSNKSKQQTLLEVVNEYINSKRGQTNAEPKRSGDTSKGDSSAYYYLAQHYNYHLSRDLDQALEYIDKAIELEPKSVDFHMTKARIYKHKGDTKTASATMEIARTLDERDRYINTKAAKYQLRNDENEAALKTLGMFTRAEAVGGPLADLHDMQCMWYLTEDGQSHARQGDVGLALKRFTTVYNIFDVWQEDQFDFHSFSLRKGQIRAYVEMIRWEDRLRDHPFYTRAAIGAVKEYLKLHDKPQANGASGDDDEAALERKKAAKKARKAAQQAERDAAAKKAEPNKAVPVDAATAKKVDEDPNGVKLAETKEPLTDAMKFLGPVLEFAPKLIEGQLLGFEVYFRREKYLLALKCLLAASAIDSSNSTVKEQIARFKKGLEAKSASLPAKVLEAIKEEAKKLPSA
ncbi:hypothetical protein V495_03997 [Pseudogymnoascus sp. VKM F-4514 (FW-929)]|nr:hypothetical protein V495_03997 [Pseudogymnoascus sp. VKM F-4514 (FW-929)]KFY54322.1 hypothetical protein V497_07815 [Pseudogymnoascus sp. VKM F-4516 (FW-969)]